VADKSSLGNSDGNLWLQAGSFGEQIRSPRFQIDRNVELCSVFHAIYSNGILARGIDGNPWVEQGPLGTVLLLSSSYPPAAAVRVNNL
jgi:hypothetical protein